MKTKAKSAKPEHRKKAPETIRERIAKQSGQSLPKDSKVKANIYRPLSTLRRIALKEFQPIKVSSKSRWGRFLGKRFNLIPAFLANAFKELRQVNWPSRKTALKLTFAVIVFALIFAVFVQFFGYIFEKLLKVILT